MGAGRGEEARVGFLELARVQVRLGGGAEGDPEADGLDDVLLGDRDDRDVGRRLLGSAGCDRFGLRPGLGFGGFGHLAHVGCGRPVGLRLGRLGRLGCR
jgi:hypothetical protein